MHSSRNARLVAGPYIRTTPKTRPTVTAIIERNATPAIEEILEAAIRCRLTVHRVLPDLVEAMTVTHVSDESLLIIIVLSDGKRRKGGAGAGEGNKKKREKKGGNCGLCTN